MSWSPDGKLLVYWQLGGAGDVWYVPVTGEKKPIPILQTPFAEVFPQVSPDGKWLAYQSNETGRAEIYLKPFPEGPASGRSPLTAESGRAGDVTGKELYFVLAPNVWRPRSK